MKNLRILSLILLANMFWYTAAKAQDILTPKKQIIRTYLDIVFKTKSIGRDSFIVANSENEFSDRKLHVYNAANFSKVPAYPIPRINVFSDKRLLSLIPERALIINYYVTKTGEIKEVTFTLKNNTIVNADELATMEFRILTNIQTKISFYIPVKATKGEDLFILRDEMLYRRVLDRTAL